VNGGAGLDQGSPHRDRSEKVPDVPGHPHAVGRFDGSPDKALEGEVIFQTIFGIAAVCS
jgi:hypothetical protein